MGKSKELRQSRAKHAIGLPKGAYRLPTGGFVMPIQQSSGVSSKGSRVQIVVRAVRRENPDLKRLAHALFELP